MKKIILPLMTLVAIAAGTGAGYFLRPKPEVEQDIDTQEKLQPDEAYKEVEPGAPRDYVAITNPFVIPIFDGGDITSMLVLSITIEVEYETGEVVYVKRPKLRDKFLNLLFDYSNIGGFNETFTDTSKLASLRKILLKAATDILGDIVSDVLIVDIVKRDV